MAHVRFTHHLKRYFPDLAPGEFPGDDVRSVLASLEARWPGILHYLVDERGALRQHVNVFVDSEFVQDRQTLSDPVGPTTRIDVMQALSGG